MDVKDLMKNAADMNMYDFKVRLNRLVRENYRYKNLSPGNRKIVLDIVNKYISQIRRGEGVSSYVLTKEAYRFHQGRVKLGLTEYDLKDIKEILKLFQK